MEDIWSKIKLQFKQGGMYLKLLYVNVAVYLLIAVIDLISGLMATNQVMYAIAINLGASSDFVELIYRPWTIFTYMFVHDMDGIWHVLFNLMWLFFLGKMLEEYLGAKKILALYILGGIAGLLLQIVAYNIFPVFSDMTGSLIVGASGAVFAVAVALVTYAPKLEVRLFGVVPVQLIWLIGGYFLIEFFNLDSKDNVAHFTHVGGGIFGFVMASQYKKGKDITKWFDKLISFFVNFKLERKPKMKVAHSKYRKGDASKPPKDDLDYNSEKADNQKRLDAILDKIKIRGYDGLTKAEKDFLNKF